MATQKKIKEQSRAKLDHYVEMMKTCIEHSSGQPVSAALLRILKEGVNCSYSLGRIDGLEKGKEIAMGWANA